ncbi:unnamed protein product [Linum trigynum]|uniref:Uncharacterized protein n=1 Tax=Linum trigynum TaxID=586398 RepID=A0AAV2EJU5_9ROSI
MRWLRSSWKNCGEIFDATFSSYYSPSPPRRLSLLRRRESKDGEKMAVGAHLNNKESFFTGDAAGAEGLQKIICVELRFLAPTMLVPGFVSWDLFLSLLRPSSAASSSDAINSGGYSTTELLFTIG